MPNHKLPPELVSLIHHVELNRAGWWEQGIQRFILAALWLSNSPLSEDEIIDQLKRQFAITADRSRLLSQVKRLHGQGILVTLPDRGYRIAEHALAEFQRNLNDVQEVEKRAQASFSSCLAQCCPQIDKEGEWKRFNENLLLPLVREIGARTYELLSGVHLVLEKTARFSEYLAQYQEGLREDMRRAVVSFLDPKNAEARSYILRYLNSYFFLAAGNLEEKTLEAITKSTAKSESFTIFVDTNFIFSILDIHDNPSNEAAVALLALVQKLSQKMPSKLYVFPLTVDEIKRVIGAHIDALGRIRFTPNLASAAAHTSLSGITTRYSNACAKAGRAISADEYFGPYLSDLVLILRKKNVELYNERIDQLKMRQDVIDDIMHQREYETKRHGLKAKTYAELEHDVVLWHFAREKRPAIVESPLEAKFFVVTVDYHFLGFDGFKRKNSSARVPVCLHPTALIQLLQFWVPRNAEFEEAVLGSLRWPFLFQDFDQKAEHVTLRILETLSRFENVGELSAEVVTSLLVNEALRQRLAAEPEVEKRISIVREALVEENRKINSTLKQAQEETKRLRALVTAQEKTITDLKSTSESQGGIIGTTVSELERERQSRAALEKRISDIEAERGKDQQRASSRKHVRRFAVGAATGIIGLLVVGVGVFWFLPPENGLTSSLLFLSVGSFVWAVVVGKLGVRHPDILAWPPFTYFVRGRRWLFAVLGAIIVGVVANAVSDVLKSQALWP